MGLPTTEPLMKSFIEKHQSCNITSMIKNYENKNIEDLYSDVDELLNSQNMVLHHIPIMCATNEIMASIEDWEGDENYLFRTQCNEHLLLESRESESRFESVYDTLEQLKHSLGKHVFESLRYDKTRLSEYCTIIEHLRKVAGGYPTDIITTNYDLLIENCCDLLDLQIGSGFDKMFSGHGKWNGYFAHGGDIKLLKLHGSLNWHKDHDETPLLESVEMQYDPARNIWIEPSPQKVGTDKEPFKTIREEFKKILDACDLLVVIGFSFNDEIWKNMIKKKIEKEDNKMRLLYISKGIPDFPSSYGTELIIVNDNYVDYKNKTNSYKKTGKKYRVDWFKSKFDTEHIDNIIKVIEHAKNRVCTDMQFR